MRLTSANESPAVICICCFPVCSNQASDFHRELVKVLLEVEGPFKEFHFQQPSSNWLELFPEDADEILGLHQQTIRTAPKYKMPINKHTAPSVFWGFYDRLGIEGSCCCS